MASTKTEKMDGPRRVATGRAAKGRRERASMPGTAGRPTGKDERRKLGDLLGDYSEQTGSFFG